MQAELIEDVLYGPAQMLGGSRLEDDELIELACEEFEGRPFCIVRNWMVLDLLLPEAQESEIRGQGLQPSVLYVHQVVFDSKARFSNGDSFITSYQKDIHGCFFESKDKLYILAGRGARKHVSLPAVQSMAAYINRKQ